MPRPTILFLISVFTIVTIPSALALEQDVVEMQFTDKSPVIDGRWTTSNEWKNEDAESTSDQIYVLTKHDRNNLYLMLDVIPFQVVPAANNFVHYYANICFDTKNDGSPLGDSDDICFNSDESYFGGQLSPPESKIQSWDTYGNMIFLGSSGDFRMNGGFNSISDPYESGRNHKIYEFQIPLSLLHKSDKYGFSAQARLDTGTTTNLYGSWRTDYTQNINWPDSATQIWGTLVASNNTVTAPPIPIISVSTKSISYGSVHLSETSAKTITISNLGTGILKVNNIQGIEEFSVKGVTPVDIPPNQSISFEIAFAPITLGQKSGNIDIQSNDFNNPVVAVAVQGEGTEKGKSPLGGGCLIATATFGSELAPQVQLLRELRDRAVLGTHSGTSFMAAFNQFYYSFSPTVADWERQNPIFKEAVKITITPMLSTLSILNYVGIDSDQKMLGYGIGIIMLNVGMYFVAPALVIMKLKKNSK